MPDQKPRRGRPRKDPKARLQAVERSLIVEKRQSRNYPDDAQKAVRNAANREGRELWAELTGEQPSPGNFRKTKHELSRDDEWRLHYGPAENSDIELVREWLQLDPADESSFLGNLGHDGPAPAKGSARQPFLMEDLLDAVHTTLLLMRDDPSTTKSGYVKYRRYLDCLLRGYAKHSGLHGRRGARIIGRLLERYKSMPPPRDLHRDALRTVVTQLASDPQLCPPGLLDRALGKMRLDEDWENH